MVSTFFAYRANTENKIMYKVSLFVSTAFLISLLAGCGINPGEPMVRSNGDDGEGPIVPGCLNVSRSDASIKFNSEYYLTTSGSAFREGGADGLYEGAKRGLKDIGMEIRDEELRAFAYGFLPESTVFCRVYDAKPRHIYKIVEKMIPQFGYRWEYRNRSEGLMSTDYVNRSHKQPKPKAKWRDRFFIDVKLFGAGKSIVRVSREVYIARRIKDGWSEYIKGTSVGYNEAVILNRIDEHL